MPGPKTIPVTTDDTNTLLTESADGFNGTAGTSNTTDSPDSANPESTPSEPKCLEGWAVFLICFGAVLTVFLLAGIPMMIYCILQGRQLPPQACPSRYSCKIYTTPEEQAFPLE
ncbi:uncharacterized protein LOC143831545 [Paroedura picta]|uniref:uncharacterized protein LOC143831545 n=1 Tax=Paroedura picta TaxID=143630 RepID=UPI004057395B